MLAAFWRSWGHVFGVITIAVLGGCGGGGNGGAGSSPSDVTYVLGGTVAGLVSGGQLLLLSGAGTQVTLKANGNFEFPDRLRAGTPFTIAINRHPVGQNCTVSPSAGMIPTPGADLRTLTVVCVNSPYQLGGTVTGLATGASLTLRDGGRDDVTALVSANGTFSFPTRYAQGATYAVSVLTQPAGQDCRVTAPTGTFGSASVSSVAVTCTSMTATVSGTVTGLAPGQSVALSNNASERLTLNADGTFQFATPVSFGGSYNVVVETQPTALVCSVSEGSGSNTVVNVTGVRVTCSARSYAIGGTVVGLSGTSTTQPLTLVNNGQDPVRITSNGAFLFATPQPSGSNYAVTVAIQPSGQTCSVLGGAGKVDAAEVRSVSIQCVAGAWRSRVLAGSGVGRTTDGIGTTAEFAAPAGSVLMPSGQLLVAEVAGSVIRRVSPTNALVNTYSGGSLPGYSDSATTRSASYRAPYAMAVDRSGNVYIADSGNHVIRRIDAFSGMVTTLAGTGQAGTQNGPGPVARFNSPQGVAVDAAGTVYVADTGNHVIRRIAADGSVTTLAGTLGTPGYADGAAGAALFRGPSGVAVDASGQIYVSDGLNGTIRMVSLSGQVSTLAGNGKQGDSDGVGQGARFANPTALFVDAQYVLYIADSGNHKVKTLQVFNGVGTVQTLAGTGLASDAEGENLSIGLRQPLGLSMTPAGELVVSEAGGHRLRLLSRIVTR
jgi:hypothetical protein